MKNSVPFRSIQLAAVFHIGILGVLAMNGCGDRAGGVNIWDAVANDDADAIERYADAGGDLNCTNFRGNTPLLVAYDTMKAGAYKRLLERGADPNTKTSDGLTLVALTTAKKNWDTGEDYGTLWLRLALEHGGDPNLLTASRASKKMITPLNFAISIGSLEHAKLLIDHGADVNFLDESGQRPLITAMGAARFDVVLLLLESGADYTANDTLPWSFLEDMRKIGAIPIEDFRVPGQRERFEKIESWLRDKGVVLED